MREMFSYLFSVKGNDRACLWTEPLWSIPFSLYMPFMTLFMYNLGVSDVQIGIILSVGLASQVVFAILGGALTDKYGRRLTTFVGDVLAWSIPALIWAFSQNYWWFLAGAMVNGTRTITMVSWHCLWTDDKNDENKSSTQKAVNWLYVFGQIAIFFAPISGFFVARAGVVPIMRVLFLVMFVMMTVKFVLTYVMSVETERGLQRMRETENTSLWQLILGYKRVFRQVSLSPGIARMAILRSVTGIFQFITATFFALYATQNLGVAEEFMAYFPILRAAIMLTFLFLIQSRLNVFKPKNVMFVGLLVYILGHGLLLLTPPMNLALLFVYVTVEACAGALFLPRLDTQALHAVRPRERARMLGVYDAMTFAVAIPFGYFAGFLSDLDRRLPFVLNLILFVIMMYFVMSKREKSSKKSIT